MEVIDLPFISIKDELAYMEVLDDPRTQTALKDEEQRWAKIQSRLKPEQKAWKELLDESDQEYFREPHCIDDGIEIRYKDHGYIELKRGNQVWNAVYAYERVDTDLFIVEDTEYVGSEIMKLTCLGKWSIENVGPSFVINKNKIYVQGCKSVQRYYTIDEVDIAGNRKTIITTTKKSQTLTPLEYAMGNLWYMQASQRHRSLWSFDGQKKRVVDENKNLLGFSYPYWYTDTDIYNVRTGQHVHQSKDHFILEIHTFEKGILITYLTKQIISLSFLKDGKERFIFTPNSAGKLIKIKPQKATEAYFLWFSSTELPRRITFNGELKQEKSKDLGLVAAYSLFGRKGYHIPVTTVYQRGTEPRGLVAYVYGHYHIPTPTHLVPRWWSFMKKGFAVSFIGVRGGGDDGLASWDAGRANNRSVGLLDYISAIGRLQVSYGIKPSRTILYGRSAGGFHVANAVQQVNNPKSLCGAVWAEAPYVDVLKGCVNYDIPVTPFERDEFFVGESFEGFHAAVKLDPVLTVPKAIGGGVTILATDGLHDTEVMYWEPLKWCYILRKNGWNKVACRIDPNTGHFMMGEGTNEKRAKDCAYLLSSIGLD